MLKKYEYMKQTNNSKPLDSDNEYVWFIKTSQFKMNAYFIKCSKFTKNSNIKIKREMMGVNRVIDL